MGFEELKQAGLWFPLEHHGVRNVGRLLSATNLSRRKVFESGTWGLWGVWLVKGFEVLFEI